MVAILEDDAGRAEAFRAVLAALGVEHVIHDRAAAMNAWLAENLARVTLLSLDHDLGPSRAGVDPGIGREVADFLAARAPRCPVIVHSSNGPAAQGMVFALEGAGWTATRVYPIGGLEWIDASWRPAVAAALAR